MLANFTSLHSAFTSSNNSYSLFSCLTSITYLLINSLPIHEQFQKIIHLLHLSERNGIGAAASRENITIYTSPLNLSILIHSWTTCCCINVGGGKKTRHNLHLNRRLIYLCREHQYDFPHRPQSKCRKSSNRQRSANFRTTIKRAPFSHHQPNYISTL